MTGTPRDRIWVAALALARLRGAFTAMGVLDIADLGEEHRGAAVDVLRTMREYGFLERAEREGAGGEGAWRAGGTVPLTDADPSGFDGSFTYLSAPVTRYTFAPDAVREWVESRLSGRVLNLFAGGTRLDHDGKVVRNDVDEAIEAEHRVDARDVADAFEAESFDTVLLDPPLSIWNDGGMARVRTGAAELVRVGGRAITFGRDSTGMGSTRGFEKEEICLVNHPGGFRDTIAVVERRTRGSPFG